MKSRKRRVSLGIVALGLFLLLCSCWSVLMGSAGIAFGDSMKVLLSKVPLIKQIINKENINPMYEVIIWQVRMPRILQAALVGGSLAVSGCTFQAVFRNPLADPHILGISSGASLGATLGILSGMTLNFFGLGVTSIFAFIGAILTVSVVYRLGTLGRNMVVTQLLLVGTAIGMLLSAMISLLMIYHREQLEKVYLWTLGSFSAANWQRVQFLLVITVIGVIGIFLLARELNVLMTGDEVASSLGIETEKLKKLLIVMASLLVAASVSVSGVIGFVGLIIPHCMRLLLGPDHKILIPAAALGGAGFMIFCDTLARTIAQPTEIPVGVITAVFGAPYFIFLLYRSTRNIRL